MIGIGIEIQALSNQTPWDVSFERVPAAAPVIVRPQSDPSRRFDTCLVMKSDNDSKLTNEFARSLSSQIPTSCVGAKSDGSR